MFEDDPAGPAVELPGGTRVSLQDWLAWAQSWGAHHPVPAELEALLRRRGGLVLRPLIPVTERGAKAAQT